MNKKIEERKTKKTNKKNKEERTKIQILNIKKTQ